MLPPASPQIPEPSPLIQLIRAIDMQPASTKQLFACQLPRYEETGGGWRGSGYRVSHHPLHIQQLLTLGNKKVTTHNDLSGSLKPVNKHLMVELPADK